MLKAKTNRKRLFRAALALADMTAAEWCYREKVRTALLSTVLNGTQDNAPLERKIDAFIEKHRPTYDSLLAIAS